jgi:catechol 2,3-dioxygenase-like lactoylglutathione lyase family enzyme
LTATIPTTPHITKVAKFLMMPDNLEEGRRFYSGVLGSDEVFRHQRAISGPAELSVFKVNSEPYIEVAPALQNRGVNTFNVE